MRLNVTDRTQAQVTALQRGLVHLKTQYGILARDVMRTRICAQPRHRRPPDAQECELALLEYRRGL
jgi:hypothetical protein